MRTGTRPQSTQSEACSGTSECHKATQNTHTPFLIHAQGNLRKMILKRSSMFENMGDAFFRICSILSLCNQNGMVFTPEKFQFASRSVEFAGFQITKKGIQPTGKYITAIKKFPTPTNISLFGLIDQVAYSYMKTDHMAPFCHLLSQSTTFEWNEDLNTAFKRSWEKIVELIEDGVAALDMNLVTCFSRDYRKEGMGWILQQRSASALSLSLHVVRRAGDWCWQVATSVTRPRKTIHRLRVRPPQWPGACRTQSTRQWDARTCTWPLTTPP